MTFTDTIVAPATAPGGAIAVVRLSGSRAVAIADSIFRSSSGSPLAERDGYTITYGRILGAAGETVDRVLVSLFRAPRSYTGEDMVEISAHASPYIVRRILDLCAAGGARPAEPGEFTMRAFLSGKMDLAQAEAVADLIASSDRASHALASAQLRGGYSGVIADLRAELLRLASLVELELDFSEEDVTFADRGQVDAVMARLQHSVADLADSFSLGNALREGVPVVIAGEPNVGKSTLLNALVREERAMVSDIAGTTRDVIEESVVTGGIRFRFLDTAGLREGGDSLERMGIERTHAAISRAMIILWTVDASRWLDDKTAFVAPPFEVRGDQRIFLILNKADRLTASQAARLAGEMAKRPSAELPVRPGGSDGEGRILPDLVIAAKSGVNVEGVKTLLEKSVGFSPAERADTTVTAARHHNSLTLARQALDRAREALAAQLPADLLAEELRDALHHLGSITGQITSDEILSEIFSKFCIGK